MSSVNVKLAVVSRHLDEMVKELVTAGVLKEATVVLVGSLARGAGTWRSDADFVVITPEPIRRWNPPIDVHLHFTTRRAFLEKLDQGNDFEAWAVRLGKVCLDPSGWWLSFMTDGRGQRWPDWRLKVNHARKRQSLARELLDIGDHDAAEEEYLMAAAHIARALLLRAGIFPLSRPEMPAQLREAGMAENAEVLDRLIQGTKEILELNGPAENIERQLDLLEDEALNPSPEPATPDARLPR